VWDVEPSPEGYNSFGTETALFAYHYALLKVEEGAVAIAVAVVVAKFAAG